ncbi:MAG: type II toxin-antitoxin system ParD family antitoxin [Promethearchaeota archaeon]
MEVASVRLTKKEQEFLERLIAEGKYNSISEILKAGLYTLMQQEELKNLPWKDRSEVRRYFTKKKKQLKGLEEIHDEDD